MCDRWQVFETFLADIVSTIGRRPNPKFSLDRIDNDKGYEPGNVRWATKEQQSLNSRITKDARGYYKHKNRYIARIRIDGKRITLGSFSDAEQATIAYRKALESKRETIG